MDGCWVALDFRRRKQYRYGTISGFYCRYAGRRTTTSRFSGTKFFYWFRTVSGLYFSFSVSNCFCWLYRIVTNLDLCLLLFRSNPFCNIHLVEHGQNKRNPANSSRISHFKSRALKYFFALH